MTLLSLKSGELLQKVESEFSTNPALELVEERRCPMCKRSFQPQAPV
jgi:RNA polymerase sigma-54 factor